MSELNSELMSEAEILKECTELAENEHHELGDCWDEEYSSSAIFGLIMLYKQTKKELNNIKEIEKLHQEENGKLRVELEQEKARNEKLQYKIDEKDLIIDGMKEDRRIAIEEIREEYYISKDKIRKIVDEHIPKQPNIITGETEYTPNTNANSFLVQDILKLLEEN